MNAIFTINENGSISALWTDAIPLQEFGELKIERASSIEFNADTQQWEVRFINKRFANEDRVVYSNPSRSACIAWEVEELNRKFQAEQS